MYRGEGDESELASLSAPVMSLSKRSIIFNGAQLQGKREKRRAQNLCMKTHTDTTVTYADNKENYRLVHTYTKCSDREHTHAL